MFEHMDREGLALPNVPSVHAQSVGGVLATACHGSGASSQGLAAAVEAIGLVTVAANGSAVTVEARMADLDLWQSLSGASSPSLWNDAAITAARTALERAGRPASDATAIRAAALRFDAARAHLGAMGVVVWAELRCVRAFWLESIEWLERTDAIFAPQGPVPAAAKGPLGWPSAEAFLADCGSGGAAPDASCASRFVDVGRPDPSEPALDASRGCVTLACLSRRFEFLKLWRIPHTPYTVVHAIRRASDADAATGPQGVTGLARAMDELQSDLLDFSMWLGSRLPSLQPVLNRVASLSFAAPRRRVAPSHGLQVIPFRIPFHTETEWSVPARHSSALLRDFDAASDAAGGRSGFVQEWRMVAPETALASPDQPSGSGAEPRIHVTLGLRDPERSGMSDAYFGAMERAAAPLGGRPHWAKRINTTALTASPSALQALYPVGQLRALAEAARAVDPHGVFRNAWLDMILGA